MNDFPVLHLVSRSEQQAAKASQRIEDQAFRKELERSSSHAGQSKHKVKSSASTKEPSQTEKPVAPRRKEDEKDQARQASSETNAEVPAEQSSQPHQNAAVDQAAKGESTARSAENISQTTSDMLLQSNSADHLQNSAQPQDQSNKDSTVPAASGTPIDSNDVSHLPSIGSCEIVPKAESTAQADIGTHSCESVPEANSTPQAGTGQGVDPRKEVASLDHGQIEDSGEAASDDFSEPASAGESAAQAAANASATAGLSDRTSTASGPDSNRQAVEPVQPVDEPSAAAKDRPIEQNGPPVEQNRVPIEQNVPPKPSMPVASQNPPDEASSTDQRTGTAEISDAPKDDKDTKAARDVSSSKHEAIQMDTARPQRATAHSAQVDPNRTLDMTDKARFIQRVARAIEYAGSQNRVLRFRLHPPELGSLKLEISVQGGQLSARFHVETHTARALLLDSLPALRQRLADQAIRVQHVEINLAQQSLGDGGTQNFYTPAQQQSFSPGYNTNAADHDSGDDMQHRAAPQRPSHDGLLDTFV